MRQLVPACCRAVNGLLLSSETGKKGKIGSGGLKGPDLRAPAERAPVLLPVGSHHAPGICYLRDPLPQGSPCSLQEPDFRATFHTGEGRGVIVTLSGTRRRCTWRSPGYFARAYAQVQAAFPDLLPAEKMLAFF